MARRTASGAKYRINRPPVAQWHSCCVNTPYRQYAMEQVREVLSAHRADFLFLDIVKHGGYTGFGQDNLPLCYCEYCRKRFEERYHMGIPAGREEMHRHRKIVQDWEYNVLDYELVADFTDLAQSIQPGVPVTFNETVHFNERTRARMNAHFSEGRYGSWETASMARLMKKKKAWPKSVISCHPTLAAFDPIFPAEAELSAAQVAAWDCEPFAMNGPQDAWGRLDPLSMRQLAEIYPPLEKVKDFLDGRTGIATIAVFESDLQKHLDPADHSGPLVSAIRYLTWSKYPFGVITEADLARLKFGDVKMLVVPRARWITAEHAKAIRSFVRAGGILLSSADFSLSDGADFALADVLGVHYKGADETYKLNLWGSYMRAIGDHPLAKTFPQTRLPLLAPLHRVEVSGKAEVLARQVLPCIGLAHDRWVNWFPPPPVDEDSDLPAVVLNRFGKGTSVYFSSEILDRKNLSWPLAWFTRMLETLLGEPTIRVKTDYPETIDATYYRRGKGLVVHLLNKSVEGRGGEGVPVAAGELLVDSSLLKVRSARALLPKEKPLKVERIRGGYRIKLPAFKVHTMVVVE